MAGIGLIPLRWKVTHSARGRDPLDRVTVTRVTPFNPSLTDLATAEEAIIDVFLTVHGEVPREVTSVTEPV